MKRIIFLILNCIVLTSCFKDYNDSFLLTEKFVEFENAVFTPNASGKPFPIMPNIFSLNGVVSYRVNMSGQQSDVDQVIDFKIVDDQTSAVEGRDFRFVNGKSFIVPKNSSFGYVDVEVLPSILGNKLLVIELLGNSEVKSSKNYKTIGISMSSAVQEPDPNNVEDNGSFIHVKDVLLGSDSNVDIGCFIDLQTSNIYTWEGAALFSDKAVIAYLQSGNWDANFAFPGGAGITGWQAYYNRTLSWPTVNIGTLVKFTNATATDDDVYDNISSGASIQTAYNDARAALASRHGEGNEFGPRERVRKLSAGDYVFLYSSTNDYYAIIKIKEAPVGYDAVLAPGYTMRFEYKVQKAN